VDKKPRNQECHKKASARGPEKGGETKTLGQSRKVDGLKMTNKKGICLGKYAYLSGTETRTKWGEGGWQRKCA